MGIPKYITPEEYSKRSGLGIEEVKRQCRIGNIDHIKTEGGYYKIIERNKNEISQEKYEEIKEENTKLKTIISMILKTANQVTEKMI